MRHRGIAHILLFSFFMPICFYTPVFASFFEESHGFTGEQITFLFACFSLTTFLFEIPTGMLGDKIGEKLSLVIGAVLTAVSTLLFIVGNTVLIYSAEVLFAIGGTFFSGPFDALVYKYCNENHENYEKVVSKSYSLQWFALCVSFAGCYFITNYGNIVLPFYATLIGNLCLIGITFLLPWTKKKQGSTSNRILKQSIRCIVQERTTKKACILNVVVVSLLTCGYQVLQVYLADSTIESNYNGLLYFFAALMASIGSYSFGKLNAFLQGKQTLLFICGIVLGTSFLGLSLMPGLGGVILFVCVYRFVWGIISPMFAYMVNKSIPFDECRDTVFSIISLLSNLVNSMILFLFGVFKMRPRVEYLVLAGGAILVSFLANKVKLNTDF